MPSRWRGAIGLLLKATTAMDVAANHDDSHSSAMPAPNPVPGTPTPSPDAGTPTESDTPAESDTGPPAESDTDTDWPAAAARQAADRCALLELLPTELLFDILGWLRPRDLSSTVRSCRRLHAVGTARLYAHVPLGYYGLSPLHSPVPTLGVLQALANPSLARNAGGHPVVEGAMVAVVMAVMIDGSRSGSSRS